MNCGQTKDQVYITFTFGAAKLRPDHTTLKKPNLTPKRFLLISLDIQITPEALGFTVLITLIARIIETNKAAFVDEVNFVNTYEDLALEFQELPEVKSVEITVPIYLDPVIEPVEQPQIEVVQLNQNENLVEPADGENALEQEAENLNNMQAELEAENLNDVQVELEAQGGNLRRSQRIQKPAINTQDYMVYLQEAEFDWGEENDPTNFSQAISSEQSTKWTEAMEAELKSMYDNQVWELVEPTGDHKAIGCEWVFKTKRCADGSI